MTLIHQQKGKHYKPKDTSAAAVDFYPANLLIPVGPILSIPFDAFFYISLHYIPSHKLFTSPLGKQLSINLEGKQPLCHMSVLNVVNICLIHLIETVRDPFGIPTSKLPCFYTLRFLFFYFYLLMYFLPASFDIQEKEGHRNTCVRTEMKMNDPEIRNQHWNTERC